METGNMEGTVREVACGAQQAVGKMAGDASMELSGKANQLYGKTQQLVADLAVVARETMAERPLAMLGAAVGIGIALGALWARRPE